MGKKYNVERRRGISFRRVGKSNKVVLTKEQQRLEKTKALCISWDSYKYGEFTEKLAQVLHTRLESKEKNLPVVVFGDAKFPPLPMDIFRYYLLYNPENFIGEYEMKLYGENAFLVFFLDTPEDFDAIKEIAHRTVYLGSMCRILLVVSSDAALPQIKIQEESIIDYDIVFTKNGEDYLPVAPKKASSEPFEYMVPKKL